jgi:putative cell wall-binding protein
MKGVKEMSEFSLDRMKEQLKNYFVQIVVILLEIGYDFTELMTIDKKQIIELILKEFYESLLVWKGKMMEAIIYPSGKHPLRFIGNKERFYDEYLNKITKFASDYNSFYKSEARFLNQESFRMIKKLAKLYELTYIYK